MRALFERVRDVLAHEYDIRRAVGTGGMATVFEAWDPLRSQSVAIKVLKPQLSDGVPRERFRREVAVASILNHGNIVPILASGEKDGVVYYTMPFVDGETLRHRLIRDKTIPLAEAIQIASEIASALEHAHGKGVMHRDVKPENILLSDGRAVVTDFGIARAILDDGAGLTITGTAVGTPNYMSPEQATGGGVDGRTDVYSLGCVLHEMIVGVRPFAGLPSPFARDPKKPVEAASKLSPQPVPTEVDTVLQKALAWSPEDRFDSAAEMQTALEGLLEITGPPKIATTGNGGLRGWLTLAGGAAAFVAAGFFVSRLIGPTSFDPAVVLVGQPTFGGPAVERDMVVEFVQSMNEALEKRVGITLEGANEQDIPHFFLDWNIQLDTTGGTTTANVSATLRRSPSQPPFWAMPAVTTTVATARLSEAGATIARDVAAAIRNQDREP